MPCSSIQGKKEQLPSAPENTVYPSDFKFLPPRDNHHSDFCDDSSVTISLFFLKVLPHIYKHVSLFSFLFLRKIMLLFISGFFVKFLHATRSVVHLCLLLYGIPYINILKIIYLLYYRSTFWWLPIVSHHKQAAMKSHECSVHMWIGLQYMPGVLSSHSITYEPIPHL